MPAAAPNHHLVGLTVLERGWLSCNNVILHGDGDGDGAVLVDSSHSLHATQTVALLRHALKGEALVRIVNTHLHSDHCGGNAAVQSAWGCHVATPVGTFEAARTWDTAALGYQTMDQVCTRFSPDECIKPGETVQAGRRRWQAVASPGHDPHSLMYFDAQEGVLLSADALWENGFGAVFPELEGVAAFDEVAATLDLIESLDARCVIPGHGSPFADVPAALQRARKRLAGYMAEPARHARHGCRVLMKYHLMEVRRQRQEELLQWFVATPLIGSIWHRLGRPEGSLEALARQTLQELLRQGALSSSDGWVADAP
jgi:glyoxylase-like metal-dependent hydrolase (beta-lactamase superfamily II)